MSMTILTNDFHGTEIRVRDEQVAMEALDAMFPTPAQRKLANRIRDTLCGAWRPTSHEHGYRGPLGSGCECGIVR